MGEGFRTLIVWQKAYKLALSIYKLSQKFPRDETYGITSQIRRAAVSISLNIAEGYERQQSKDYARFLVIAKGSLGEVETLLMFVRDLGYIEMEQYNELEAQRQEIGKLLRGLINSLR